MSTNHCSGRCLIFHQTIMNLIKETELRRHWHVMVGHQLLRQYFFLNLRKVHIRLGIVALFFSFFFSLWPRLYVNVLQLTINTNNPHITHKHKLIQTYFITSSHHRLRPCKFRKLFIYSRDE